MTELNETEKQKIMKNIEKKTENIVNKDLESGTIAKPLVKSTTPEKLEESNNTLKQIMNNSTNEFKEKIGRNPSYLEMREMYG